MKCFQHPEKDAIGICTECGKGVCQDCYIEDDGALYCCADCAPESRLLHKLWDRFLTQIVTLLFGVALVIWFINDYAELEIESFYFTLTFGIITLFAFIKTLAGK